MLPSRLAAEVRRQVPLDQRAHVAERASVITPGMTIGRGKDRDQSARLNLMAPRFGNVG
jgi:hypothetical protein